MKLSLLTLVAGSALAISSSATMAQKAEPSIGGAPMSAKKTIAVNASAAPTLSTLVSAVKAADLLETLNGPGPYTLFAPTNDAFKKLPAGTMNTLAQPDKRDILIKILTYHVVAGFYDSRKLMHDIQRGGGTLTLKTVQGEPLVLRMGGKTIKLTDPKGGTSLVTTADVYQSNGVVHVIDSVLMPN